MQIKHPSLENYNLNLEGLIGPENGVFHRGRITSQNEIKLPTYWCSSACYCEENNGREGIFTSSWWNAN